MSTYADNMCFVEYIVGLTYVCYVHSWKQNNKVVHFAQMSDHVSSQNAVLFEVYKKKLKGLSQVHSEKIPFATETHVL